MINGVFESFKENLTNMVFVFGRFVTTNETNNTYKQKE